MNYFERFKLRWNIQSNKQLVIVFTAFGVAGFSTLGVKKILLPLLGVTPETPLYLKIAAEVLIILPAYQVLLIIVGSIFGQYRFFKRFLRKMFFLDRKKKGAIEKISTLTSDIKTAILIVNTGTPRSSSWSHVAQFLFRFLNDKRVIDLPFISRTLLVTGFIIPFRLLKSTRRYRLLMKNSTPPLLRHTQDVAARLNERLPENMHAFYAMRYSRPSLKEALSEIEKAGYEKIILIPQFPQYAEATTGSILAEVRRLSRKMTTPIPAKVADQFYRHSSYINALSNSVRPYLKQNFDHIIFSFHSLPLRQANKTINTNACYRSTCCKTASLTAQELGLKNSDYSVCYQSKLSHGWLGPFIENALISLAKRGKERVLIVAPSFVADCLETNIELALEIQDLFIRHGGQQLEVVPCLNSSPLWIQALLQLIQEQR